MITKISNSTSFRGTLCKLKKISYKKQSVLNNFANKPLLTFGTLNTTGSAVCGLINNKTIQSIANTEKIENIIKNYPEDEKYRLNLASAIGLSEKDAYKISSIAGVEELADILEKNQNNPDIFSVGEAIYDNSGKLLGFKKDNIETGAFGINLHIHTENSDGQYSVKKLLEDAANYANKRMSLKNEPFYIAITDHDSIEACKEAVEIVKNSPDKFKNLRIFLGMETTTLYRNVDNLNKDCDLHILSYRINPYSQEIDDFLTSRIINNHTNINNALKNAKKAYSKLISNNENDFNLDDFSKLDKAIKTGLKKSNYYLKDYLQFKLIYSQSLLNNDKLQKILADNKINLSDFDYTSPIKFIEKNPDYSKGQKYYEYYFEALKNAIVLHITNKKMPISVKEILTTFSKLPDELKIILDEIEKLVKTKNSNLYISPIKIPQYRVALNELSQMKDGVLSIAHPGLLFPNDSIKSPSNLPQMYCNSIFKSFKEYGGNKAKYIEGFYQSYYNTPNLPFYEKIIELGKQAGYKFTGGLNTHSADIFSI